MIETRRIDSLKEMLNRRRAEIQGEVGSRLRDSRGDQPTDGRDDLEVADAHCQGDIAFALLQMKAETLIRIDEALARLDAGKYGLCVACGREIAERRLNALPFAVRCQACEERRERTEARGRRLAERRGITLFPNPAAF